MKDDGVSRCKHPPGCAIYEPWQKSFGRDTIIIEVKAEGIKPVIRSPKYSRVGHKTKVNV